MCDQDHYKSLKKQLVLYKATCKAEQLQEVHLLADMAQLKGSLEAAQFVFQSKSVAVGGVLE